MIELVFAIIGLSIFAAIDTLNNREIPKDMVLLFFIMALLVGWQGVNHDKPIYALTTLAVMELARKKYNFGEAESWIFAAIAGLVGIIKVFLTGGIAIIFFIAFYGKPTSQKPFIPFILAGLLAAFI